MATENFFLLQFKSSDFTPRTPESYNYHCALLDGPLTTSTSTIYGVTHNSPLNELSNFHVIDQLPQDIMHILLEGVVPYELSLMLSSFIGQNYFSHALLNDHIACYAYSTQEAKNRPSHIKPQAYTSQGVSLNQSCELKFESLLMLLILDNLYLQQLKCGHFLSICL